MDEKQTMDMERFAIDLMKAQKSSDFKVIKALIIIIAMMLIVNIAEVCIFIWYEHQMEDVVTTTTTTIEQDTGSGSGNNIYQSGEHANYNEGGENDAEAENNNYNIY